MSRREAAEHDLLDRRRRCKRRSNGGNGDRRGKVDRIAVDARADAGKGERRNPMLRGELERAPVARREKLRLAFRSAPPNGSDGVDHKSRRQAVASGQLRVARIAAAEATAL